MADFEPFTTLCRSTFKLTDVKGQVFVSGGPPMLVKLRLTFERIVVLLVAEEDDSITVINEGSFSDQAEYSIQELSDSLPWKLAMGRPLLWTWRMINQQGYFDGIQLDFAENVEETETRIQLLTIGSQFEIQNL